MRSWCWSTYCGVGVGRLAVERVVNDFMWSGRWVVFFGAGGCRLHAELMSVILLPSGRWMTSCGVDVGCFGECGASVSSLRIRNVSGDMYLLSNRPCREFLRLFWAHAFTHIIVSSISLSGAGVERGLTVWGSRIYLQ